MNWPATSRLPRRRRVVGALLGLALGTMAADHLGRRGRDDWSRYNHRAFGVAAVPDGQTLQLDDGTTVRLLGLADPAPAAVYWLEAHVRGNHVTLLLPSTGIRDADGRLGAYAFVGDDGSCVNVELVRAGLAYADRRADDLMAGAIQPAENEARRKGRGLWQGLRFDQMPPWRQAWLRSRERPAATRAT